MATVVSLIQNEHASTADSIEVIDEEVVGLRATSACARIRVREEGLGKASIFLTPDELETHGRACVELARNMRARR